MKNEKSLCCFNFMPFTRFMVQKKDDITTFCTSIKTEKGKNLPFLQPVVQNW